MAADQSGVALDICTEIVMSVNKILDGLDKLEEIKEMTDAALIDLELYETQISTINGIKHCDPATYKNILLFQAGIVTAMKALYTGTPTQQAWAGMQKART